MPALTELRLMKTAIVTGGSSGIGLSCCRKFLENGYRVYELSRREPKIQTVGVKHISCDVTDEHSVSEAFKKIYNDSELTEDSTIRKFRIVQKEGNREVSREEKNGR